MSTHVNLIIDDTHTVNTNTVCDYEKTHTGVINQSNVDRQSAAAVLNQSVSVKPCDGTVINHFPLTLTLKTSWNGPYHLSLYLTAHLRIDANEQLKINDKKQKWNNNLLHNTITSSATFSRKAAVTRDVHKGKNYLRPAFLSLTWLSYATKHYALKVLIIITLGGPWKWQLYWSY